MPVLDNTDVQNSFYTSGMEPQSSILKSSFISRLSSLFGYRATKGPTENTIGHYNMEFVRVDLNNEAYRFKNAALGSVFSSKKLSDPLEKYFDAYMEDNSLSYNDIQDRQKRLNELSFFYYNDDFGSRVVELTASEATQLDVQNRLISVESPNLSFSNKCYELFNAWGITQQRTQGVCWDLELYGESFWAHKIGLNGVEKIIPIKPNTIMERLEFSGVHMAEYLAQKDGYMKANRSRSQKLNSLIDILTKSEDTFDLSENIAEMFDNKLFGYELHDGIIVPPWCITHFRYNAEHSEFYPYGRPPLLNCLAPFKQMYSTMMLQGLARAMSFPITMYKVKGTEGMGPAIAFEHVNTVREEYDNLGVTPASAGGEVYTVNTKIWVPDGLVDIDVKESKCDIDFIGDLELYQDRVAIASGVPKAYLDQEFGGFGNSGIALTEQYKPFARHVYTIQSAFLEGLGELIRLHFAITGEFDYNTPFILSMTFPAEEMSQEKRDARNATLEMSQSIIELVTGALGLEEGEPLPDDVIVDILSKYSFLDPTDIQKWMRKGSIVKASKSIEDEDGEDGGDDMDFGDDMGGGDMGMDDMGDGGDMDMGDDMGDGGEMAESRKYNKNQRQAVLREQRRVLEARKARLKQLREERLREVSTNYKKLKEDMFFHYLEEQHLQEYKNSFKKEHVLYVPKIIESSDKGKMFNLIRKGSEVGMHKISESTSVAEMMENCEKNQFTVEELHEDQVISDAAEQALKETQAVEPNNKEVI